MEKVEQIHEAALIEAINRVDRYRHIKSHTLTENVSALAEIWGTMVYERAVVFPVTRLTSRQRSAWNESKQGSLLDD